jgi:hypothetical protein
MRKRTFIALLLLAAFSLGFVAGPHLCQAEQGEPASPEASCHEAASSEGYAIRGSVPSHEDGASCCDTVCRHACHMPAAGAGVRPASFTVELVSLVAVQGFDRVLPPLAHPIDHVPLA